MKKGYKVWLGILIVLIIALSGVAIYRQFHPIETKEQVKVNILDTISEYDYSISDRDSELYKKEFNELKSILTGKEIDNKAYSEKIARLFIIDLYSIKSKINKYDVGGLSYYYSSKKTMFETKVKDTLYDLVEDDSYGDRVQQLPMVSEIETILVEEGTYEMDGKVVNAYIVTLSWSYEKDLGYDTKGIVTIVNDGIKQSVVSYKAE